MEKLEQFLDQVCQGIGGPLEMRDHVRQELREHLLDAVAQHKAAGLSEADALAKALEEFGKPEEVRSELEATHGRRMTWIIDKAMQWKEKTMKAKWVWVTWAHLALMGVIALEALFITFNVMFIIPKFRKLMHDGIIDDRILNDPEPRWMVDFLMDLSHLTEHYTTLLVLVAVVVWGVFEWRVRSENKTFMRISALGTVAVGLMAVVMVMSGSLVIVFCLGAPALSGMVRPWAVERVDSLEKSIDTLEQARIKKDWPAIQKETENALNAANGLQAGAATHALVRNESAKLEEVRANVRQLRHTLLKALQAIEKHDEKRLDQALQDFRKAFAPVREAAKKPPAR